MTTFLLGGDLPVNRIGFGAMRLPASGSPAPHATPKQGVRYYVAPSNLA